MGSGCHKSIISDLVKLLMDLIKYEDFERVDFRVGEIVEATKVEGSEKLIKLKVDLGEELGTKQAFSGIYQWYKPEELVGKKTVFVVNIEPKIVMGELSEVMIFATNDDDNMSILSLDREVKNGSRVF